MDENDEALSKRATQERLLISKMSRQDLEDKHLILYDEHIVLKKYARKQEDRMKKMATKLVRLVEDKKKSSNTNNNNNIYTIQPSTGKRMRDVDTEEYIAELQAKLAELETQNKRLKENLQTTKLQLQTFQAQKNSVSTIYSNVTARIDTGLPKRRSPSYTRNIRPLPSSGGNLSARSIASVTSTPANNRIIEELEIDNQELKNRLEEYESYIDSLNEQLRQEKSNHEEALLKLKNQVSQEQILGVQENIDQIRMQREVKEKSNQYTELYSKFTNLTQQHTQLKDNHNRLLDEIDRYNQQLKQEQQKNLSLKTELKNLSHNSREIFELKERIEDLNRENEALKDANQKLLNSAFSLEREREFRERERTLKIQIAQLEATLKSDVGEKGTILDRLNAERDQYDKLNTELRDMQVKYYEMKQKYDDMNEKMQFLSKESNIDFTEIEEALILVKERRANKNLADDYLNKVDAEKIKHLQRKLVELEAQLAETIGELEKSRHLLITQVKINDDYKKEVHLIQGKMEENKAEYDTKMLEYAQLLDIRAARIKKLERQLKDIVYGTKQVRVGLDDDMPLTDADLARRRESYSFVGAPEPHMLDHHLIANLERGQNIFEIHLTRLILSEEALRILNETDPSTFCTIEFFEHELQTTSIVKGQRPEFNFTSQYIIKVDDFFLHYLQKETTTVELHHAIGSDYVTKAACQLSFRDLIDQQVPRIHGSARLLCVNSNNVGVTFGTLEYWARLIVPVDEAFRLYKERTKALGYLSSNLKAAQQHDQKIASQKAQSANNMNELNINILRCSKINSTSKKTQQPSPYCVYRFYDFKDHDTEIIPSSNYPEFNDHKSFAVPMDIDLDKYLKSNCLEIYVFDDNEPENSGVYLGFVKIPLIGLAHGRDIKGTFEIKRADGSSNGTIDITLYWQYSYLPPTASTFSASGSKQPTNGAGAGAAGGEPSISLLPGEKLNEKSSLQLKAQKMGVKLPKQSSKSPKQSPPQQISPKERVNDDHSAEINVGKLDDRRGSNGNQNKNHVEMDSLDPSLMNKDSRRSSQSSGDSIGNATIRDYSRKPSSKQPPPPQSPIERPASAVPSHTPPSNPNYEDTMFGDEHRTYSPNELDSLRSNYESNLANLNNDEENSNVHNLEGEPIEEENSDIEEEIPDQLSTHQSQQQQQINEGTLDSNYNNTGKTDDDVVVGTRGSWQLDPNDTSSLPKEGNKDYVIIEISNFSLNKNSKVLKRNDVKSLFVGMSFLNYDPGDLESKNSVPKPLDSKPVYFNFRKIFDVSQRNMDKREELARMIIDESRSFFSFAVVSENNEIDDCEDIGYAYVDIMDILKSNKDYHDEELLLYDAKNKDSVIGKMVVTVEILEALKSIQLQLAESTEMSETF